MAAKRKYRWEKWFDQDEVTLVRGVDYNCSQSQIVQYVRNRASQVGLRVSITDEDTFINVKVVTRGERSESSHSSQVTVSPQQPAPLA